MKHAYWLMKSEPEEYSWDDLIRDGSARWDGVRNFQARNNIAAMRKGDMALFYHSGKERLVAGVMRVASAPYRDPTADDDRWLAVDVTPGIQLPEPVTLAQIKAHANLKDIPLVKQARLSVMPLEEAAFKLILALGGAAGKP